MFSIKFGAVISWLSAFSWVPDPWTSSLRLFSVKFLSQNNTFNYDTYSMYSGRILCINASPHISSVISMKIPQNAHIDNVFFCQKSCRKLYTVFPAIWRQRDKSDVIHDVFWYDRLERRLSGFPAGSSLRCWTLCESYPGRGCQCEFKSHQNLYLFLSVPDEQEHSIHVDWYS
jgi:hypothetical protein